METGGRADLRGRDSAKGGQREEEEEEEEKKEGRKETEKGKVKGKGKERKEEIIFDRMFRRGGSEFRIGGGARGARIVSWRGWVR